MNQFKIFLINIRELKGLEIAPQYYGILQFRLSDEGALKEIKKLVKLGVLKSEGKGRSVRYLFV